MVVFSLHLFDRVLELLFQLDGLHFAKTALLVPLVVQFLLQRVALLHLLRDHFLHGFRQLYFPNLHVFDLF